MNGGSYEWPIGFTLRSRFEMKVRRDPSGCLIWTAFRNPRGYGMIRNGEGMALAHRVAWVLEHGEIEGALHVLHTCDTQACVNVGHLYLGTNADNIRDKVERGRSSFPQPSKQGEKHHNAKLTERQVRDIRDRRESGETGVSLAAEFGVSPALITRIRNRELWAAVR